MRPAFVKRIAPVALLALILAACSSDDDDPASPPADPAAPELPAATTQAPAASFANDYERYRAQPTACGADQPPALTHMEFERPDDTGIDLLSTYTATISTSCGDITVELDPSGAPLAVNSFIFLAQQGYYNGIVSHRIDPDFMFQTGDPNANGSGNPGYLILRDEWPATGFAYDRGVVAMANAGPQTTGSQFFIVLVDGVALPANYTVLGRVVDGEATLDAISAIPVAARPSGEVSLPLESLYIESITVDL
jgi:cyclophilin family peptidyl-prolyl cis-trans isomerase